MAAQPAVPAGHLSIKISDAVTEQTDTPAPEKKLILFALQLAVLEKAASGIGALGFIWATVVLLGGFAITLERKDFWFVTVILLVEGARIFSRSHELKWQHQSTWSVGEARAASFRAIRSSSNGAARSFGFLFSRSARAPFMLELPVATTTAAPVKGRGGWQWPEFLVRFTGRGNRTWGSPETALHPKGQWDFLSLIIGRLLYWLQLISATACVILSIMRLAQQDYGDTTDDAAAKRNRRPALNIFYGLALSEALLFLAERAYWEWKVSHNRLLEEVNRECGFGPTGLVSVRRFFYDAYSRCIAGSVFDGMKMDMVSFAEELLGSGSRDEQLIGARILLRFAMSRRFAEKAMRKIGTSAAAMDRLVEMLNWKSPAEEEIRTAAAVLVAKLAGKKQNALRVAGIPGAMESIASLLYTGFSGNGFGYRLEEAGDYEHSTLNLHGLLILKKLANEHDNCAKIGSTRGLLPRIIDFTTAVGKKLRRRSLAGGDDDPDIETAKRALQVIKLLAAATGSTGELLRREISEIVFAAGNIREILQHAGDGGKALQKLGLEILTSLAMEGGARERIGATGGMLGEIMRLFFDAGGGAGGEMWAAVRAAAGGALAMLVVESRGNCARVLRGGENVVGRFVEMVGDSAVRVNACEVLRNMCEYGEMCSGGFGGAVLKALPVVLNSVMFGEMKELEASIGFAAQIVRFISPIEFAEELESANISENQFVQRLVHILQKYNYPSIKTPRIRRFVMELSIWMMQSNEKYVELFHNYEMAKELEHIANTTTDVECFVVFSGYVGITQHKRSMASLVEVALELLAKFISN